MTADTGAFLLVYTAPGLVSLVLLAKPTKQKRPLLRSASVFVKQCSDVFMLNAFILKNVFWSL